MTLPRKQIPPPPASQRSDKESKAVYAAMLWASSNGCQCQSCAILRQLYMKVSSQIAQAALKELEEEE